MSGKRVVIVGSNFAGFTAALKLRESLPREHEIVVLSRSEDFLFMPSLIWLPFGLRTREDISFAMRPIYEKAGVVFKHTVVTGLRLAEQAVDTTDGPEGYDYLVIATGPRSRFEAVPGMGPDGGYSQSIFSLEHAERAGEAFTRFLEDPGPVVIGAAPGAACFGAAYEFLLNFSYQVKKRGLRDRVTLTYITAEPFLGHFGIGGIGQGAAMCEFMFKNLDIERVTDAAITQIHPEAVELDDGRRFPFRYAMITPAFEGVPAVKAAGEITNAGGFVKVDDAYRTEPYKNVYAAGVAVALAPPHPTRVPCGVPKTGYLSEEMAKVVAHNITADILGGATVSLPPGAIDAKCVLDAGNTGLIMSSDHFLEPRSHEWLIPGPEAHWAKLAFEKYFLTTRRHGWV